MPYSNRSTDLGKRTNQGPSCSGCCPEICLSWWRSSSVEGGHALPCLRRPLPHGARLFTADQRVGVTSRWGGATPRTEDSCRRLEFGRCASHLRPPTFYRYPERDGERERTQINSRLCKQSSVFPILSLRMLHFFRLLLISTISQQFQNKSINYKQNDQAT